MLEAKSRIPGLHLGTDIIVGFPGETDAEFADSLRFISELEFANIHVFAYSPRPGTRAAEMPDRPSPETVRCRSEELRKVAADSARRFAQSQFGKTLPVIFERIEDGLARGWSDNYLEVTVPASGIELGRIVRVVAAPENLSCRNLDAGDLA